MVFGMFLDEVVAVHLVAQGPIEATCSSRSRQPMEKQLAAGGEQQEEEHPEDGNSLPEADEQVPLQGELGKGGGIGKGPDGRGAHRDKDAQRPGGVARQRGAEGTDDGPGELDQDKEDQGRIDAGFNQVGIEVGGGVAVHDDVARKAADQGPEVIDEEEGKTAPQAAVNQQADHSHFGNDAGGPQDVMRLTGWLPSRPRTA